LLSEVIGTGQPPYKTSCATADFAAVMAIAARLYRSFDPSYADRVLHAAEAAWRWVEQNPNVIFHNPPGITTGEYGDADCGDERLWAAAELFRTTGNENYSQYFLQHYREYLNTIRAVGPPSWSMVGPLALWTYVLGDGKDAAAVAAIRQQSSEAADRIAERASHNAYRISQLLVADRLHPDPRYVHAAWDNLHYILGRNAFSLSWVTHVGEHAFQHPHHRPSGADEIGEPWPGLMSGGPNPGREDPVMKRLVSPDVPRAKAYLDETGAYACNEVAINWNAPLVFTLAASLPQ
jgi:endoglucanase